MSRYRSNDFDDRDYPPAPRREEEEFRRRAVTRSPPRSRAEFDDVDVRVRDRERERESGRPLPVWLRDDGRRPEHGTMVLRKRDVETFDRRHPRSPSPPPVRVREERIARRPRSVTPPHVHEHERVRIFERERVRSPSIERRSSPSPVRILRRRRSSSSSAHEHIRTRIVQREERAPSPSPSPPPVTRGPTEHREVITHYTDIDHGVIRAKQPTPSPPPRPRHEHRGRETDIDISLSKHRTEVDVDIRQSRSRSRHGHHGHHHDDLLVVDDERLRDRFRRRAHSAAPARDEAREIAGRIDSRGRMGEAWGGATKDWAIVDVPPGTERVRMDGAGGATTDTTWSQYSGVRRTKFVPEREREDTGVALVPTKSRAPSRGPSDRNRLSVSVYDREQEIDIVSDRRIAKVPPPPPPPAPREMWTEMTKDLVCREAIEKLGYRYEETKWFYYIMEYLRYDDVLQLTDLSAKIKRARKERALERQWRAEWEARRHHGHHHHHHPSHGWDAERVRERETEVIVDDRRPVRGYLR